MYDYTNLHCPVHRHRVGPVITDDQYFRLMMVLIAAAVILAAILE